MLSSFAIRALMLEMRVFTLLFSVSVLCDCTAGNWHICGPQTPRAYCDKAVYDALVNPPPIREDWAKSGTDSLVKAADWEVCGGLPNGNISPDRLGATGKETADLSRQKFYDVQRCMISKGYQYIGTCEGDVPSRFPACQAKSR